MTTVMFTNTKNLNLSKGEIQFENITFNYLNGKKIFDNFSLTIKGGQKIGLVGFSGSGKTTFVNLILKLFKVQSGKILIDNQDINEISEESLKAFVNEILFPLWNMGLKIDYSVRNIDDVKVALKSDYKVILGLLDARYVCGQKKFSEEVAKLALSVWKKGCEVAIL